ncbi:TonB-dependent receptor plug domain-containing protein, partial [bacterium]|nr:TonB-dependent receptor plug domain-containing protein [bacterium]
MLKRVMLLLSLILMSGILWTALGLSASYANVSGLRTVFDKDSILVYHLGEIVVVKAKKDVPKVSVSEINNYIMNATGTNTVKAALNSVPGVVVTNGSKGESRIQIRGFKGRETMILLDGRPISLPYYGDLDLNSLPISNISKIKVVKGPASAVYGANTLGGLVNIVSKRINTATLREMKLSFGKNNTYNAEINLGAAYRAFDYWVSLGLASSDGYSLSDDYSPLELEDGGLRDNSDYRNFNLDTKLNYTFNNGTVLSMSSGYYNSVRSLPTGTDQPKYQEFPDWRRYYIDLGGDGLINKNIYWKGKIYYDVCKNRLKRYGDDSFSDDNLIFNSFHDSFDVGSRLTFT